MLVITCLIVCPETIGSVAGSQELSQEHMNLASEIVVTQRFAELFRNMCHMDSIPDINLQQIKFVKSEFIDTLLTNNQDQVVRLGNAGRLLGSWIDGILEYTVLKHEVVVLRLKNKRVLERIQAVSQLWPKKKEFIEGAYKILLFSKGQRKYAKAALEVFGEKDKLVDKHYFDYPSAFARVMKSWYEKRIREETLKNQKL